jgi:NADPH:quinone reductase-like Zn-dependent oxidoreductase
MSTQAQSMTQKLSSTLIKKESTMKAMVYAKYGAPEVVEMREVPRPTPQDNEVLVQIHASAVGSADSAFRRGESLAIRLFFGLSAPKNPVLGTELAGVIVEVGEDVSRFKVGDKVVGATSTAFGTHAEYICVNEDDCLIHKSDTQTFEDAVAMTGGLTALSFLRDQGNIQKGQRILINGASGSVGSSAVELARYFGAEVTAVCSTRNVEWVRELGAHKVIDYTVEDFTRVEEAGRYDIVFDVVGKSSFGATRHLLKRDGIYMNPVLKIGVLWQMMWTSLFSRQKVRFATTGMNKPESRARDLQFLTELYEQGLYKPVIGGVFDMENIVEAHRIVDSGHKQGNVVIRINDLLPLT